MSKNSQLSPPAVSGDGGIEKEQTFREKLSGVFMWIQDKKIREYPVMEIPLNAIGLNSVRMEPHVLRRFAQDNKLPVFSLKVEETIHSGIPFPVQRPYQRLIVICQNIILYSAVFNDTGKKGGESNA